MTDSARQLFVAALATALFVALGLAIDANRLSDADAFVRAWAHSFASPYMTSLMLKVTALGSIGAIAAFGAIALAVLLRSGDRPGARLLVGLMGGALVLENALKALFARGRPPPFFGTEPQSYSFPSGHALFSLCFYGALAILGGRHLLSARARSALWIAAASLALAIGGSRIYLGVHFPTDVLGGYLIAIAWIALALNCERRLGAQTMRWPK